MTGKDKNQGEGNTEAARRYNEAARESVDAGVTESEASNRKNVDDEEQARLERAADKARERAAETDPAVTRDHRKPVG